jgi:hypothetical protein
VEQAELPDDGWYVPGEQLVHIEEPDEAANVPALHGLHEAEPELLA